MQLKYLCFHHGCYQGHHIITVLVNVSYFGFHYIGLI